MDKRTEDKEGVLRFLVRKGSLCNTYKAARELEMERGEQKISKRKKTKERSEKDLDYQED